MLTLLTDGLVPIVVLAHAEGLSHVHPHGLDAGLVLLLGGLAGFLALRIRRARRER